MDCLQMSSKRPRISSILDDNSALDRISKLPDDILIRILDKMSMEEAAGTSLLSKSWKDLWKYKRNVKLSYKWAQDNDNNGQPVSKFFSVLSQQNIHCLCVCLFYKRSMSTELQLLMEYTSSRKVEELFIDFNPVEDKKTGWRRRYESVSIPECESHKCSSLVKLSMKSLNLETLPPSRFKALRELLLERAKLSNDFVENITKDCPLALLYLSNCNPTTDLNILIAPNSNLDHLVIREEFTDVKNSNTVLRIRAENVKTIEFSAALPRKRYQMEGTLTCSEAIFRLDQMHIKHQAMRVYSTGIKGNFAENFLGLLRKLADVHMLTLTSWCIQVLSVKAYEPDIPALCEAKQLILETRLGVWRESRGVANIIYGCCKLENLVILIGTSINLTMSYRNWAFIKYSLEPYSQISQEVEVVEFNDDAGNRQTQVNVKFNEFLRNGSLLIWDLRKRKPNLKKFIFSTGKKYFAGNQIWGPVTRC